MPFSSDHDIWREIFFIIVFDVSAPELISHIVFTIPRVFLSSHVFLSPGRSLFALNNFKIISYISNAFLLELVAY